MARNWHGPLSEWVERFAGWMEVPSPQALLVASIFFDFRRVGGELDLEPLEQVLAHASDKPVFLRFLARSAMEFHPKPSLLLRLKGEASEVDLKLHGISPIVFLARCYGLAVGSQARNTLEALKRDILRGSERMGAAVLWSFQHPPQLQPELQPGLNSGQMPPVPFGVIR